LRAAGFSYTNANSNSNCNRDRDRYTNPQHSTYSNAAAPPDTWNTAYFAAASHTRAAAPLTTTYCLAAAHFASSFNTGTVSNVAAPHASASPLKQLTSIQVGP
jgi:hypothetical protein